MLSKERIKDGLLITNILSKLWQGSIAVAPYVATAAVTAGIAIPAANELAMRNDRVIEENQNQKLEQIVQQGDSTAADLEALEKRLADSIVSSAREQANSLRDTAATLTGELQATALDAANALDTEATRLDGDLSVTSEELNQSVFTINETLTGVQSASLAADNAIIVDYIDLNGQREAAATQLAADIATNQADITTVETSVDDLSDEVRVYSFDRLFGNVFNNGGLNIPVDTFTPNTTGTYTFTTELGVTNNEVFASLGTATDTADLFNGGINRLSDAQLMVSAQVSLTAGTTYHITTGAGGSTSRSSIRVKITLE